MILWLFCAREWDRWLLAQRRRMARSGSQAQALLAASGIWCFLLQRSFSSEGQLTINHRRLRQHRLATAVSVAWKRASSFGKNVCGAGRRALPAGSGQCRFWWRLRWEKQGWLQLVPFWVRGVPSPQMTRVLRLFVLENHQLLISVVAVKAYASMAF